MNDLREEIWQVLGRQRNQKKKQYVHSADYDSPAVSVSSNQACSFLVGLARESGFRGRV